MKMGTHGSPTQNPTQRGETNTACLLESKRELSPTNTECCLSICIKSKTTVENCIPEKKQKSYQFANKRNR